jgi:anion transporter
LVNAIKESFFKRYGLVFGAIALIAICLMPTPEGLPVAGKRMLAILLFSVIVWMTDSISYPVSAVVITALMAFLVGMSPNVADPKAIYGTTRGLTMALGGFSNTAVALVGAALFIAAAMIGVILVGFVLSFFVPSTTARVSCLVPIVMGIIVAFGVPLKSKFAGVMMIATAQADSLWNVGIKTASAQNLIAVNFIEKMTGHVITWPYWFMAAAPFSAIMSVILYWVLMKTMPPETKEIAGGKEAIARSLAELGPMKASEKKLMILSLILLFFWSTEKIVHPFDTSTTTIAAIAIMLLPRIGIMTWKDAQSRVGWGTLMLFGVGVSLGSAMLATKAAAWLAKLIVGLFGLQTTPIFTILAVFAAFLIIIHLGFASATALASAMIPIIITVLQTVKTPGINVVGLTMVLQYVISFGFILPVNAPQNMVAYGTETFEVRDFIRTGIPLTIAAYLLVLILGATYWKWLGLV